MKTLILGIIMIGAAMPLMTGCASTSLSGGWPTIKFPDEKATGENANNNIRNMALDNRQMIDDINSALLMDTPSRLSKWHVK
jgi:hypothetical protein